MGWMTSPCYKCTERRVGCHGSCYAYKLYAAYRAHLRQEHLREADAVHAEVEARRKKARRHTDKYSREG